MAFRCKAFDAANELEGPLLEVKWRVASVNCSMVVGTHQNQVRKGIVAAPAKPADVVSFAKLLLICLTGSSWPVSPRSTRTVGPSSCSVEKSPPTSSPWQKSLLEFAKRADDHV